MQLIWRNNKVDPKVEKMCWEKDNTILKQSAKPSKETCMYDSANVVLVCVFVSKWTPTRPEKIDKRGDYEDAINSL